MIGAMVVSWGAGIPGREAMGLQVFGQAVGRFEELAKQGRIHSHKEYFTLTGRDGGFMILEGEVDELMHLAAEPETLALNTKAASIVQDFEVQVYAGGSDQTVQALMGQFTASLQEIGYL